ncbi:MAG: HAMP domain-containing histidine kinase [Chloroflexi bacterium]|nr:HAMP domain-containing histidine kinase [Chloroflexota bacterium]
MRNIYLVGVSVLGLALVGWGLARLPTYDPLLTFFLLLALAVAAQIASTSLVGGNVTVEVSTAVTLAVVALYGATAASVAAAAAMTVLSSASLRTSWPGWRRAIERIGFNIGISAIAIFLTGLTFEFTASALDSSGFWGGILPWLLAAVVHDQVNLWLLIGLLHLQNKIPPLEIWRDHKWAIPINVLVMSVGGGILAVAVQQFNYLGIAIFFLPIVLSAYSFRLYVDQTKKQMEKLEDLVDLRTQDLAEANKELEQLSKDKDDFLAVLTHDMRTPLTSIKGYSSILRDRELGREQQVKIAKIILRSEENLLEIVNNILDIEKLQSGLPILLERSAVDLALLVRTAIESISAIALEKNIVLQRQEALRPIIIMADEKQIQRVLLNLISNAIKYTLEGGNVSIDTRVQGHYALIEVKDTGYGIPEDELPFIFERLRRVKRHQRKTVGTGLSLAIAKGLAEAHGGEILATSEVDVGSVFTIKLPL